MCAVALEPPAGHRWGGQGAISEERNRHKRNSPQGTVPTEVTENSQIQMQTGSSQDIDLTQFDPPVALSADLADIDSETVILVVISSLQHVTQQIRAEKHRTEAAVVNTRNDTDPEAGDETRSQGGTGKGKGKDLTDENDNVSQTDGGSVSGSQDGSQGSAGEKPSRPQLRRRLGLRRMFRHSKGGASSFTISEIPAHLHGISPPSDMTASPASSRPSSLTQFIYKHVKQTSTPGSLAEPM